MPYNSSLLREVVSKNRQCELIFCQKTLVKCEKRNSVSFDTVIDKLVITVLFNFCILVLEAVCRFTEMTGNTAAVCRNSSGNIEACAVMNCRDESAHHTMHLCKHFIA